MLIYESVLDLVGHTPLLRVFQREVEEVEVCLKLEARNPGGSVKDRAAANMVREAEKAGKLTQETQIVEPTSGNTGIGLAMVAAARGYKAVIVLPESSSAERIGLLKAYGAEVVLSPAEEGMKGAVKLAEELVEANPNSFMPQQFKNWANPDVHRHTTAEEIYKDTEGRLDYFVASAGTGGTITGTGQRLRELLPELQIVVVEPASSPVISGGEPGSHKIPGMGPGFIPDVLDLEVFNEIVQVTDEQAHDMARRLAREEGLLAGLSTGAVAFACLKLAKRMQSPGRIVGIAPDTGERYLSTGVFD